MNVGVTRHLKYFKQLTQSPDLIMVTVSTLSITREVIK